MIEAAVDEQRRRDPLPARDLVGKELAFPPRHRKGGTLFRRPVVEAGRTDGGIEVVVRASRQLRGEIAGLIGGDRHVAFRLDAEKLHIFERGRVIPRPGGRSRVLIRRKREGVIVPGREIGRTVERNRDLYRGARSTARSVMHEPCEWPHISTWFVFAFGKAVMAERRLMTSSTSPRHSSTAPSDVALKLVKGAGKALFVAPPMISPR